MGLFKGNTMNIKVAKSWWNKLDAKQQTAFIKIMQQEYAEINPTRNFLTAAKKEFGEDIVEYRLNASVLLSDGSIHHYMRERNGWCKQ